MDASRILLAIAVPAFFAVACGSGAGDTGAYQPPPLGASDDGGINDGSIGSADATTPVGDGVAPSTDAPSFVDVANIDAGPCSTVFRYVPPAGQTVHTVAVTGEWNNFVQPGVPMTGPDAQGAYTASVSLAPGMVGYKLLLDGVYSMDPGAWLRKFVGAPAVENSAVMVVDCHVPTWTVQDSATTRTSAGAGHFVAHATFNAGQGEPVLEPTTLSATLRKDGTTTPLPAPTFDPATSKVTIDVPSLADGKYTVFVEAKDRAGHAPAEPLRLVFWVEPEAFDWHDAVLYMIMTDRFEDGDPTNDAPHTVSDIRVDYQGGDLQGITHRINDGTFDKLGVRALWLSPFNTNPPDQWPSSDGVEQTMGYHGYWATKAREVDARIGGEAGLHALVTAAHAHGIRVIQDFMLGDIHQEHEYVAAHPSWFLRPPQACVCGTANCDWTVHRLDCVFAPYLPRIDWTNPAVSDQFTADAVWWVDTFDLDGFRIDAVKHLQDNAITNVSWAVRHEFEASGLKFFMTGETAMGWSDCTQPNCPGNGQNYGTISQYIGPFGLDGQFDFVLYYAVPSQVFMTDNRGMIHADYWTQASQTQYPKGAIMSSYIGSQDTPRFVTSADTSGGNALAGNQWTNIANAPTTSDAYGRIQMAMEWMLTTPGAPMIYNGDEYGQWGSADPNNRTMWRGAGGTLTADELATQSLVQKLGTARRDLVALRRGAYVPVSATEPVLVFARQTTAGQMALVAITRATTPQTITATLPASLAVVDGTVLHDHLGGADVAVAKGAVTVTLPSRGAAILAP